MQQADTVIALKERLAQRLEQCGYKVTQDAKVKAKSGAEHTFDMMAYKDDGFTTCSVAIGIGISFLEEVGLGSIFNFDTKAYDAGIWDKAFIAVPKLGSMPAGFAKNQNIKVFDGEEIESFLNGAPSESAKEYGELKFATKAQLLKSLAERGYRVEEMVKIKGKSGVDYTFDIVAYNDDGFMPYRVAIDVVTVDTEVDLKQVSLFDTKAYDAGIHRKVLLVSPKLSSEASQFAKLQKIKVFERGELAPEKPAVEKEAVEKEAVEKEAVEKEVVEAASSKNDQDEKTGAQLKKQPASGKTDKSASDEPIVDEALPSIARLNVLVQAPMPEALKLIPENLARKHNIVPLAVEGNTLKVAMANPDDILAIEAIAARTKRRIEPVPATLTDIREAIDFNYKAFGEIAKQFGSVAMASEGMSPERAAAEVADDSPLARALNVLAEEAVKSRASDIHIEPEEDKLRVRYRIDGILHEVTSLPLGAHSPLISRIKILSGMNIADPRRPQDGQFSFNARGRDIDVRVATISGVHGEMAVLRLLDKSLAVLSLEHLGFLVESREIFENMLMAPYGMVLLSGPTGAGKTTTLYAAVNSLDKAGRNIITIEDPVEYRFDGINQIQVNPRAGITFAGGLRAIVRLDPDVILVGEIRDSETAGIATQSALTGHLVLSSVHANDTVGVLFRLIDLGVEPFLICSAVIGIVAQRMVRRVCPHCARKITVPVVEQIAYHQATGEEHSEFHYGTGCKACTYTGYLGRTGIFEILSFNEEIKRMLISGATAGEIRAKVIESGMITLAKDGMLKAKAGITTPGEVLRNAYTAT